MPGDVSGSACHNVSASSYVTLSSAPSVPAIFDLDGAFAPPSPQLGRWAQGNIIVEEVGPDPREARVQGIYERRGIDGIIRAAHILRVVFGVDNVNCRVDGTRAYVSCYDRFGPDEERVSNPRVRITLVNCYGSDLSWYTDYPFCNAVHNLQYHRPCAGVCWQTDERQYAMITDSYYWERTDEYNSYEEPYDEDDGDDESHDGVCGYHSQRRLPPCESYDLAVELEVHTTSGTIDGIIEAVKRHGHIAEDDSSLSSGGVEIVQRQPRQLEDVIDSIGWHDIVSTLPSQANRNGYGMHVSVNAPNWSVEHETVFVAFWTANEDLVLSLAGRRYNEDYAYKGIDVTCDDDLRRKRSEAGSRYAACSLRGEGRIEVRLFRTTRVWAKFAGRVQLVDAVARWAANCKEATHAYVTNISGKGGLLEYMTEHPSKYEHAIVLVKRWMGEEV